MSTEIKPKGPEHVETKEAKTSGGFFEGIKKIFNWVKVAIVGVSARTASDKVLGKISHFEQQEGQPSTTVKVTGKCQQEGKFIGLSESLMQFLQVQAGDTVNVLVRGAQPIPLTVEKKPQQPNDPKFDDNVMTNNPEDIGHLINIVKAPKPENETKIAA